jgi:hypothetical protein
VDLLGKFSIVQDAAGLFQVDMESVPAVEKMLFNARIAGI